MSYITRDASPRLRGVVERMWHVQDPSAASASQTICPDGCAEIVIHLGEPMQGQPRHLLVGQMDAPLTVTSTGAVTMLGARLTPTGLCRLLPVPQERLRGQIVQLGDVWNRWTRHTVDRVASAASPVDQLRAFERALERLVAQTSAPSRDHTVDLALRAMRASARPLRVERLANLAGISRRQFERRFRQEVGLSPNLFGRIVRFQHAFAAVATEPGASLAARLGFVDQAHLVREVRRFSGQTPTLLANARGLTTFFANAAS